MLHLPPVLAAALRIAAKRVVYRGQQIAVGLEIADAGAAALSLTAMRAALAAVHRFLSLNDAVHVLEVDWQSLVRGTHHPVGAAHALLVLKTSSAVLGVD